jgi:hypothetical protein
MERKNKSINTFFMNARVREYLIDKARQRTDQTVTYQQLSDDCGLGLNMRDNPSDRITIGGILGDISVHEDNNDRPLLSALVIRSGDSYEGDGFYKLAENLGHGNWQTLKRDGVFEIEQINECISFWSDNTNYTRYR